MSWNTIYHPISLDNLLEIIAWDESKMESDIETFWNLLRIVPERWNINEDDQEGVRFWVIGIIWNKSIYYDDIEEWFNISEYSLYWVLNIVNAEQDELQMAIYKIINW